MMLTIRFHAAQLRVGLLLHATYLICPLQAVAARVYITCIGENGSAVRGPCNEGTE